MKKIIILLMVALFISSFSSCKKDDEMPDKSNANNGANSLTGGNGEQAEDILRRVLPDGINFSDIGALEDYPEGVSSVYSCDSGYVIIVEVSAYQSELKIMCGIDMDGKIVGTEVIASSEIPAYSDLVFPLVEGTEGKYKDADIHSFEPYIVAGATITSKGYANAVKIALETAQILLESSEKELPGVNYLEDDLSEYIEIYQKYYKDCTVTVDRRISDVDLYNPIIQTLCKYKSEDAVEGDGIISVGDIVNIYYKGYYLTDDGEPYYFNGGSNMDSGKTYALEIGSGSFIPGFEYNLIGKNPSDYSEENPLIVETYFPEDYGEATLAGVTAYFIVKVESMTEYDAPDLNDTFISETLKLTAENLSSYEGATLTEKYLSSVREQVLAEIDAEAEELIMSAFWSSVMQGAVVKKYPEKQVKEAYDAIIEELEYYYEKYYSYSYEYDEFMCLNLGLAVGSDWKPVIEGYAKDRVKQEMIIYRILNIEDLKPSDEEYERLFDEYAVEKLTSMGVTLEDFESEEDYLASKEDYKERLISAAGEEYFKSMIYQNIVVEAVKSYVDVKTIE